MELAPDGLVDVRQIALVGGRNNDGLDAVAQGSHRLLLQAADGHDPATKADLAGHCHIAPHGPARQGGDDGGGDGDTGAGAVLGDGTLGEMDVDVLILIEIGVDAQLPGMGADVAHRRPGGFLHHKA